MAELEDLTAKIEADMLANYGGENNVSTDPASYIRARIYARAVEFAYLELASRVAGRQFVPAEVTDLLPKLEWEYKLFPKATDDLETRRTNVAIAARLAGGATRANIEAILTELLGSDFLAYVVFDKNALYPAFDEEAVGNWVAPGTPAFVGRFLDNQHAGTWTVRYEKLGGRETPLQVGETMLVDPGFTRPERVTITEATASTFIAQFDIPHGAGAVFTTARAPNAPTPQRTNLVILTSSAARNAEARRKVNLVMSRALRGVSRWGIAEQSNPGTAGPFIIGQSLLGVTALGIVPFTTLVGPVYSHAFSEPTIAANATSKIAAVSVASSSPAVTANATSGAAKSAAASSSPTITANGTTSGTIANSSPTVTANATTAALKASQASSSPATNSANAVSKALKASAGSSSPTITADAKSPLSPADGSSSPPINAAATSNAKKASAGSSNPTINVAATGRELAKAAPSSAPTINVGATGQAG